jgi:hypothetical protein
MGGYLRENPENRSTRLRRFSFVGCFFLSLVDLFSVLSLCSLFSLFVLCSLSLFSVLCSLSHLLSFRMSSSKFAVQRTPSSGSSFSLRLGELSGADLRPAVKMGELFKCGGGQGGRRNWKKRWMVALGAPFHLLLYYEFSWDRQPRGLVALRPGDTVLHRPRLFGESLPQALAALKSGTPLPPLWPDNLEPEQVAASVPPSPGPQNLLLVFTDARTWMLYPAQVGLEDRWGWGGPRARRRARRSERVKGQKERESEEAGV